MQCSSLTGLIIVRKHGDPTFFCEHLFDHPKIPKSEGGRTERWKYMRYFEQQPIYEELYDLKTDTLETTNLADNTEFADQLAQLRKRCGQLRQEAERRY